MSQILKRLIYNLQNEHLKMATLIRLLGV